MQVLFVMKRLKASPEDCVIKQGDTGDKFYVIQNGTLEVIVNTAVVGFLHAGDHFGELALIYDGAIPERVQWTRVSGHLFLCC